MKRQYGLAPLPKDDRDFELGAFIRLPDISELPPHFITPYTIKDQRDTDWCTAYATCLASEVQEKEELEPAYTFAATKLIDGNPGGWGANLRVAAKSHVDYGALPSRHVQSATKKLTDREKRYFDNWERYVTPARQHRKQSYFKISGPHDHFDNIRAAIFKYKTPVVTGLTFGYRLKTLLLDKITDGYGHAMAVVGWTKWEDGRDVLVIANSYGTEAGAQGVHYITREIINHFVDRYGAFTFVDVDPEVVKKKGIIGNIKYILYRLKQLLLK